jgi:hypothetical protein
MDLLGLQVRGHDVLEVVRVTDRRDDERAVSAQQAASEEQAIPPAASATHCSAAPTGGNFFVDVERTGICTTRSS